MIKYIESKLNGATRLAVCRGDVSGEGATLSKIARKDGIPGTQPLERQPMSAEETAEAQAAQLLIKQQQEKFKLEQEARRKEEAEERRKMEEAERKKAEKLRMQKLEAERLQHIKMKEEKERQKEQLRLEEERKKRELEKQRRAQLEQERREKAEKAAQEKKRREEAERQRQLEEAARLKAEAEERERQRLEAIRQEEERRQQQIRAEQERKKREEEERRRKELERQRLEALRKQEEERLRREAIARQAAKELEMKIERARKILLWRRWRERIPRHLLAREATRQSLSRIDPTFSKAAPFAVDFIGQSLAQARATESELPKKSPIVIDIRRIVERCLGKPSPLLDIAPRMADALLNDKEQVDYLEPRSICKKRGEPPCVKTTLLYKVAVFLPDPSSFEEESMCDLVHTWLDARLGYGIIDVFNHDIGDHNSFEVRFVFVRGNCRNGTTHCDAALFVVPPPWSASTWSDAARSSLSSTFASVTQGTPRVVFVLGEESNADYYDDANEFIASCLPPNSTSEDSPVFFPSAVSENAVEGGLVACLGAVVNELGADYPPVIERISLTKLACVCISDTMWESGPNSSISKRLGTNALDDARAVLLALLENLVEVGNRIHNRWSSWPLDDFTDSDGSVPAYFGNYVPLPSAWTSSAFGDNVKTLIKEFHSTLEGNLSDVVDKLLYDAPDHIREECDVMIDQRQTRRCIQRALLYLEETITEDEYIFLPRGTAENVISGAVKAVVGTFNDQFVGHSVEVMEDNTVNDREEVSIDIPPEDVNNDESTDDGAVFNKAEDIFEISRTISPLPGLGSISPPPENSNLSTTTPQKRNWMGMNDGIDNDNDLDDDDDDDKSYPLLDSGYLSRTKRPRKEEILFTSPPNSKRSREVKESNAFTKKLESLVKGEILVNMPIGETTLAKLIRDAPEVDMNFK